MSGVRWLMLTRIVSEAVGLVAMVVLARLISPAEFGRAAVALIFLPLATILTFEGFASALVQRESIEREHLHVAMGMSLLGGALLSGLAAGLAPLLWAPLFGARTAELMGLASPVFLLAAIGGVSRALALARARFSADGPDRRGCTNSRKHFGADSGAAGDGCAGDRARRACAGRDRIAASAGRGAAAAAADASGRPARDRALSGSRQRWRGLWTCCFATSTTRSSPRGCRRHRPASTGGRSTSASSIRTSSAG